ncbi:class III lanthionine synthetase LanKC [Actinomadura vinacea]|uniref:non-specific serine/threonine protein kinase n=1 Tax=Actinomadura vinacea TaxID=115336 RepID=A0ABN3JLQ4_9ACTN
MDLRYHAFAMADPLFYDSPAAGRGTAVEGAPGAPGGPADEAGADGYAAARPVPEGWWREPRGVWTVQGHGQNTLADQGWKIHVSSGLDTADEVLDIVSRYCFEHGIVFKFLRSRRILWVRNSKYAERGGSGKFITIYPADEIILERTLRELDVLLDGRPGPYILSDLRWNKGPLFVRYGGIRERYCRTDEGELVPAIEDLDGRLVPDLREPVFRVPEWVEVPDFLRVAIAGRDASGAEPFPYRIEKALHFSNGGGLYRASHAETGRAVLVKEARPLAGLDGKEDDAVARLERERRFLEAFGHLPYVPDMVEHRKWWEHDFLVREYIEGDTLNHLMILRNPILHLGATDEEIADYAGWALAILDRVETALDDLHGRGLVFGDLHPGNIIVRPDDSIVFVDFELVDEADEAERPALGAPGYQAPPGFTGVASDRYALGCMRLAMFMSLTALLRWDDRKFEQFIEVVTEQFPLPADYAEKVRADLKRPAPEGPSRVWPDPEPSGWERLRSSLARAVLSAATPERADRLFPGDIEQFVGTGGGIGFGHGAAGVLWALAETGEGRFPEHENWLVEAIAGVERPAPGFYNGLAGVAYALDRLGRPAAAAEIFAGAGEPPDAVDDSLYRGLAGIGLAHLHFARSAGDGSFTRMAEKIADRMVGTGRAATGAPSRGGLMYGPSGQALFLIRLYEETGDEALLDEAERLLRRDLDGCKWTEKDRTLQVDEGWRLVPYLATGSVGVGIVLHEYLRHRPQPEFEEAQVGVRRAAEAAYFVQSGLFNGRAGILAYLLHTGARPDDPIVRRHLRNIGWHAISYRGRDAEADDQGRTAFIGDQLLRLSMDLGTGTAGVLLSLGGALSGRSLGLPFLKPGAGADDDLSRGGEFRHGADSRTAGHGGRAGSQRHS